MENCPKDIAVEAGEELNDMRRKKAIGDDKILVDLLKELGEIGLKIMTVLVNNIYLSGDWANDFLDVMMTALSKIKQKNTSTTEQLV